MDGITSFCLQDYRQNVHPVKKEMDEITSFFLQDYLRRKNGEGKFFMTRKEAKYIARERGHELLEQAKKSVGDKPTYICPLCKNGTGKDGDGLVVHKNKYYKCFKCDFYGDIFDIIKEREGISLGKAFYEVYRLLGITVDEDKKSQLSVKPHYERPTRKPPEAVLSDFTEFLSDSIGVLKKSPSAVAYLRSRGLSERVIENYGLGFDGRNIVVPTNAQCFLLRGIDSDFKGNGKGSVLSPFNLLALNQKEPVFVTEGEFDALSVIEAGGQAVGLGSLSMIPKFLDHLDGLQNAPHLILSLDNDVAGVQGLERLVGGLKRQGKGFTISNISGNYKDPNEALIKERVFFLQEVQKVMDRAKRPDNMIDYLQNQFTEDVRIFNKGTNRKTGYKFLDEQIGGLYTGLYVLGAISSLGKTTFVHQMADQLAEQGEHVLYFSLEQSRMELLSKSLSRTTLNIENGHSLTGIEIRRGITNCTLENAMMYYTENIASKMSILESNFNCTVQTIKEKVRQYKVSNPDTYPIVVVDYLQILQASPELGRGTTKEVTDYNVTELKRLSRDENLVVIAVSSVNRSNYLAPMDFESFKESGSIEFTADVIWGLQLEAVNQQEFESDKKIIEKRKIIKEAKAADPRKIELVCLKNRFGISSYSLTFQYYPKYDYFMSKQPEA